MTRWICIVSALFVGAIIGWIIPVHAQTPVTTPWFTVSIGATTCKASKVAQTPIRVSYVCTNQYGATAGSYTADPTNGGNGTNYFYVGLNSICSVPAVANSNLSCLVQMNATAAPVLMVNGVTVPASSAQYTCSGYAGAGSGVISWP